MISTHVSAARTDSSREGWSCLQSAVACLSKCHQIWLLAKPQAGGEQHGAALCYRNSPLFLASPFPRLSLSVLVTSPPVLHPCKRERHIFFPRKTSGGKCKTHSACPAELTFTGFPVHEISCIKRAVEQVLHLEDKGYNPQGKEDWYCSKPKAKRNKVPANRHNCKGSFRGW